VLSSLIADRITYDGELRQGNMIAETVRGGEFYDVSPMVYLACATFLARL